ncbi:DUF2914 domain-containing protein [Patescibacteria group bacterium]|nr:DUF2914 domain-containing protein [Patescibacteria group bacterium]MBU1519287.1 DUF2914 domain-containing protein [Patescibacteria group bacterium]MBU2416833.1 DUF2914 domain-containing protein [Patescibacteria group bacterium]MBU2460760.1 DUF2914 domain-containing protein [Patescibacteria group bacterium]
MIILYFLGGKIKLFFARHKKYVSSGALLLGFVVDNLTLTRIDLWFDNLILFFYLILVALGIVFINLNNNDLPQKSLIKKASPWFVIFMQYAFGGLFSGFFIFYSRSASLVTSWAFSLLFLGLMIGNEVFSKKYLQFKFQISLFFLALFSFTIFYVPVVLGSLGVWIFLLSGIISLGIITIFLFLLSRFLPLLVRENCAILIWSIGSIYFLINIFYFTNIIPPIPLSLKDAGVYHFVERAADGNYVARVEEKKWYELLKKYNNEITHIKEKPIYFYSAVFSPTDLDIKIIHKWQYFNTNKKEWIEMFRLKYDIVGGRDGGYRGYSFKENITAGRWRVAVTTERNQLLGRYNFTVINNNTPPVLKIETLE